MPATASGTALGSISTISQSFEVLTPEMRKKVTIVSRQPDKINEFIMGTLHRGATVYTAHGAFSGRDEQVITTVLNRREAVSLRNYIRRTDPGAFITIVNSSETIGKGFRAI